MASGCRSSFWSGKNLAAILAVNSPPAVTAQPVNEIVAVGRTAAFSVAATGTDLLASHSNRASPTSRRSRAKWANNVCPWVMWFAAFARSATRV
jgi:hypothetical protein